MTPTAATAAGRRPVAPKPVKAGSSPRIPRRVSGPAGGAAAIPGRLAPPRRQPARPARPSTAPRRRLPRPLVPQRSSASRLPLGVRALAYARALPDHRWLDRLVRGRAWIPVLGILLTGIVAMQVEVLKLGASIGRSMSLATELQSRNQLLRASVARLSDDQRIMHQAALMGMVMPGPTEVQFVPAGGGLAKAIAGIQAPAPQTFLASLAAQESADGVANAVLGTTPSGTASTTSTPAASSGSTASVTPTAPAGTAAATTGSTSATAAAPTGAAVSAAPAASTGGPASASQTQTSGSPPSTSGTSPTASTGGVPTG